MDVVRHMNDDTSSIPSRELAKVLYGAESPFARTPHLDDVRAIMAPFLLLPSGASVAVGHAEACLLLCMHTTLLIFRLAVYCAVLEQHHTFLQRPALMHVWP